MAKLTDRQRLILSKLYYYKKYVTGQTLASLLNVSSRTIRTDVKIINETFKYDIIDSTHQGYFLMHPEAYMEINNRGFNSESNNIDFILKELLSQFKPINIDELSEKLYISKTSLLNEIKKPKLEPKLKLIKHSNSITIEGPEYIKRKLLKEIIFRDYSRSFASVFDIYNIFPNIDGENIIDSLRKAAKKYHFYIDNTYIHTLLMGIEVGIDRIKQGFASDYDKDIVINEEVINVAKDFAKRIADKIDIELNNNDIQYFSYVLQGHLKTDKYYYNTDSIKKVVTKAVKDTFEYYNLKIDFDEYEDKLLKHIFLLIKRSQTNNLVQHPITEIMSYRCPFIYDVAVHLANILKQQLNIKLNSTEISFIAVHIGNAINNAQKNDEPLKTVFLCNDYYNSSSSLLKNITKDFGDMITITKIAKDYNEIKEIKDYDLLITTMADYIFEGEYARISYIYTLDDRIRILDKISKAFERRKNIKVKSILKDLFDEKLFFRNVKVDNEIEAINFLSQKLVEQDIADDDFCKSVLEREELSSTLIDAAFAFPHSLALNEKQTKCAILINDKGFLYDRYRVSFLIMMCVNKKDINLFQDIYNNLTKVLLFNDNYNKIYDIDTYDELIEYIGSKLSSIYN